jgi:hypothetical protein
VKFKIQNGRVNETAFHMLLACQLGCASAVCAVLPACLLVCLLACLSACLLAWMRECGLFCLACLLACQLGCASAVFAVLLACHRLFACLPLGHSVVQDFLQAFLNIYTLTYIYSQIVYIYINFKLNKTKCWNNTSKYSNKNSEIYEH